MGENETIIEFNEKLCHIANQAFQLFKKYYEIKLVRKTVYFLLERFALKVVTVDKAIDIDNLHLDELTGSLKLYKMNLNHGKNEKELTS